MEISLAVQSSKGGEQRAGGAGGAGAQLQVSDAADKTDMVIHPMLPIMLIYHGFQLAGMLNRMDQQLQ